MLAARREFVGALIAFRASLAIAEWLTKVDPRNAGWQRDLSFAHAKVGDVLAAKGELTEALTSFRASLTVAERLAEANPEPQWQLPVAQSYDKVGEALAAQGQLPEALTLFRNSLAIRERLVNANPSNTEWQWEVIISHWKLASRGDQASRRWGFIVTELRKLRDTNRLRPGWERWLPAAEAELAKHSAATTVPQ